MSVPPLLRHAAMDELQWMRGIVLWVGRYPAGPVRTEALEQLTEALARHAHRHEVEARIRRFAMHPSQVRLLAEMGLPDHPNFTREIFQRLADRLIPRLEDDEDLYVFLDHLDPGEKDAAWLKSLPPHLLAAWQPLLAPEPATFLEAAKLLAIRTATRGLRRDFLRLGPREREKDSPFMVLPEAVASEEAEVCYRSLAACEARLAEAHHHMECKGVSSDLVYRMDFMAASLKRIRCLWDLAHGKGDGVAFAAELLAGSAQQRRIRELFKGALSRLARKMVEHTGKTGEHYLVRNKREMVAMGASSSGGGALTVLTALGKVLLGSLPVAPGLAGLAHSLNYAGSFVAMQFLHLSLASKQPAATAAALSEALEVSHGLEEELAMVTAITRGQFVAALGNVLVALPTAALVDFVYRLVIGHPILSLDKANYILHSLHPFKTLTLPFAAFTGVLLWISSLVGGWTSNWLAYRGLGQAIGKHPRFQRLLGKASAKRLGYNIDHHLPGIFTCVALGLSLGFLPLLAAFLGFPIEVRHVTLSAASVGLALGPFGGALPWKAILWALVGVGLIGLLNFGVSFALSLRLAIQARGLRDKDKRALRHVIWQAFKAHPLQFFFPFAAPAVSPKDVLSESNANLPLRPDVHSDVVP